MLLLTAKESAGTALLQELPVDASTMVAYCLSLMNALEELV